MKTLIKTAILFFALSFLVSCNNDDDDYSLGKYWLTTGTVIKTTDYYYVVTDGGDHLWPSATEVPTHALTDSMRVFVNYTILGDADDTPSYDFYVRINGMSEILTKPIFNFTDTTSEATKDSIGNDPVTIVDTWFTDKYLNLEFEYGGGMGMHYINLVRDVAVADTLGAIVLELKHNKNGDPYNYLHWSIVSIDLSELETEGQTSVDIFVRSIDRDGTFGYNQVLTYTYGTSTETQGISLRQTELSTLSKEIK